MKLALRCAALVLLALGVFAAPGHAALTLCNRTSYVLYAATAEAVPGGAQAQGWSRVAPGSCKPVVPGDLSAGAYYLYARSSQAHGGPARAWGGSTPICVKDSNFANRDAVNANACATDDFFQLPFASVATQRMPNWTTTLSEGPELANLPAAQLAGLKRLLRDVGYRIDAIDGQPDKRTDWALLDFRKKMRMTPKASVDDVFDALETEALKVAKPAGYAVCNDTAKSVAAAIGQKSGRDGISHGWWKIAAGSCARLMADLGGADSVYLFVQKIGGGPLVSGPEKFCTANIEFDIQGRTGCAGRGLMDTGFLETRVKGLPGLMLHVGESGLLKPMTAAPRKPAATVRKQGR
jgi:uncharacterized membrane protein